MQNLMTLSMWSRFGEQIYKHIAQQIFISQRLIDDDNVFSLVFDILLANNHFSEWQARRN